MNDTPTPRTDALRTKLYENINTPNIVKYMKTVLHANELETELTAAREEITLLKTNLKIQTNHTENAVQDRADEHIELHNQIQELTEQRDELAERLDFQFKLNRECIDQITTRTKERDEAREQRDRLAEALRKFVGDALFCSHADIAKSVLPHEQVDDSVDALTMP